MADTLAAVLDTARFTKYAGLETNPLWRATPWSPWPLPPLPGTPKSGTACCTELVQLGADGTPARGFAVVDELTFAVWQRAASLTLAPVIYESQPDGNGSVGVLYDAVPPGPSGAATPPYGQPDYFDDYFGRALTALGLTQSAKKPYHDVRADGLPYVHIWPTERRMHLLFHRIKLVAERTGAVHRSKELGVDPHAYGSAVTLRSSGDVTEVWKQVEEAQEAILVESSSDDDEVMILSVIDASGNELMDVTQAFTDLAL